MSSIIRYLLIFQLIFLFQIDINGQYSVNENIKVTDSEVIFSITKQEDVYSYLDINQEDFLSSFPIVNAGAGGDDVNFGLCFGPSDAVLGLDRNDWFDGPSAPSGSMRSESYKYNFPAITDQYPCVAGADLDDLVLTITINSMTFNFPPNLTCCENYISGIFANLYTDCGINGDCGVFGDGLTDTGTGVCNPGGRQLEFDVPTGTFPAGLPFTSTTTCISTNIGLNEVLGIDIIPNFIYENMPNSCDCPQDAITQGYVSIDFSVKYEYIYCSSELPVGCGAVTFDPIDPVCDSDGFVFLPFASLEGISGTWSPSGFLDVSNAGGTTVTATFTPDPSECSNAPVDIDIVVEKCCTAEGGNMTPSSPQSICSSGGNYQDLNLGGELDDIQANNISFENDFTFLLVDPNGVIIDNTNDQNNLDFPANAGPNPIDYCVYGLSFKLNPGLGTIINGTTTINIGDSNVIEDGDGNPLEASPNVNGACMDLSSNCVIVTVEAPTNAPTATDISTCGGDTEITPTGTGTNFNFYDDATLSNLLASGSTYDPAPTSGSIEIWITEGSGNCESAATMITVTILGGADAGIDNNLDLCSDINPTIDLFASLNGTPDTGGTWMDNDASGLDISDPTNVDFSGIIMGIYTFTYTIPADGACPEATSLLTLNIGNPVSAGTDNTLALCTDNSNNINLLSSLGGTPNSSGTWSDDNASGLDITDPSDVDISGLSTGTYDFTYTVTSSGSCTNQSAILTLDIEEAPNSGINGTASICEGGSSIINLESSLNGTPDTGGTWTDDDATGVDITDPTNVDFNGITAGDYGFTYTIIGGECDDATASVSVSIGAPPNAGLDGSNSICNDGTTINLNDVLTGSPDTGGTWTDDDASGVNLSDPSNVDFDGITANTYNFTYNFAASGDCPAASAIATITVENAPNAGEDASLSYCIGSSSAIDLMTSLGTSDAGGIWSDDNSSGVDLTDPTSVDFDLVNTGDYNFTYTIAGGTSCPNDNAIITVSVNQIPNFGSDNSTSICEGDATLLDFYTLLGATQNTNGSWTDNEGSGVNLSDASSVNLSTLSDGDFSFTYTITGATDCPGGSSTLSITIDALPNGGTPEMSLLICDDEITTILLETLITGEDAGGTWAETSTTPSTGAAFDSTNGSFDPTGQIANTYTFLYTLSDNGSCSGAGTLIQVIIDETPTVNLGDDITQCVGDGTVNLDAGNAGATYNWTVIPDDGNNGSTNQNITISDNAIQTNVQVEVNQNGCTASDEVIVTISETPTFFETAKDCSADLSSYDVTINTTGNMVTSNEGTITNNMDGTFTISGVTAGTNLDISITNSTTNCSDNFTIMAPDCGCPTINAPTGMNATICSDEAIPSLEANADNGLEINWYEDVSGTVLLQGNSPTFTPTMAGTYYAQAVEALSNCTSTLTPISLTINSLPSFAETDKSCSSDLTSYEVTVQTDGDMIAASDGTVTNNMDGTFTISGITPDTDLDITISNSTTNCSDDFTIEAPDCDCDIINAPIGMNATICEDESIPTLSVSADAGLEINWFEDASGTNLLQGNSATFTPSQAGIFYAQAIESATSCTSTLTPISLTINTLPTFAENDKNCSSDLTSYEVIVQTDGDMIAASDGTVTNNMDGTFTISGITPDADLDITISNSTTNCSDDFTIEAPDCDCDIINAPTGMNATICEDETIPTLSVSADAGLEINWFEDASGTTLLEANSATFTPTEAGTFYAQAIDATTNCTSTLTPISLTINTLPTFVEMDKNCSADLSTYEVVLQTDGNMIATSDGTVNVNMDGTFSIVGITAATDIDITITNTSTGCSDDFTITAPDCGCDVINAPIGMDATICENEDIPTLSVSADAGLEINWFEDASGTTLLEANSATFTPTEAGTFYAQAIDATTNCTSTFTPIVLTINSTPTLSELEKNCSSDLTTYEVTVETDGDSFDVSEGIVTDNMDGTFTISGIAEGMNLTGTITNSSTNCILFFLIVAPDCSCPIFDNPIITTLCDDNGTPDDDTDDTFSYTIEMTSIGLGNTYSIQGDDIQTNLNYGMEQGPFDGLLISDGTVFISVTDDINPTCDIGISIEAPSTCSECVETIDAGTSVELNCANTSTTLQGTASANGQFDWTGPNGFSELDNPNPTVSEEGTYILTVTFDNGCVETDEVLITLDPSTPNADAGAEQTINCNDLMVVLGGDDTSIGTQYSYEWMGPNGFSSTEINPTVNLGGTYTLIVTDNINNCTSESSEVLIGEDNEPPVAVILADPLNIIDCVITEVVLTADENDSQDVVYSWELDGTITVGSTINVDQSGIFTLTALDTLTGCSDVDELAVENNVEYPLIDIPDFNDLDCNNESSLIDPIIAQSGMNLNFEWTDANGNIISTDSDISLEEPGSYTFEVTDVDNGCVNSETININQDIDQPAVEAGPNQLLDCVDMTTQLSGSSNTPNTIIEWGPQSNIVNGINDLNPTVDAADLYFMTITNTLNGCTSLDSVFVDMPPLPESADLFVDQPDCDETSGDITFTMVIGGTGPFLYNIDDSAFSQNPDFSNLIPATYTLGVEDMNGCLWDTTVVITESLELVLDLGQDQEINIGDSLLVNPVINIPESQIDTVIWTATETLSCDNCLTPWLMPVSTTTYIVEVIDENGCVDTDQITVIVRRDKDVFIPSAFSPNNDGINDLFEVFVGNNVVNVNTLQVFDRWGEQMFRADNFHPSEGIGWDGMHKNKRLDPAVFVYYAEIEFLDGSVELITGDLSLMK